MAKSTRSTPKGTRAAAATSTTFRYAPRTRAAGPLTLDLLMAGDVRLDVLDDVQPGQWMQGDLGRDGLRGLLGSSRHADAH